MAEIAIPMLALGSMYILANQNQRKSENYENLNNKPVPEGRVPKGVPVNPVQNYPVQKYKQLGENTSYYPSPNAATDRYFQQDSFEKSIENEKTTSLAHEMQFSSLTGDKVQKKDIKFNNMVPFFGAKITGGTFDYGRGTSAILDLKSGAGTQFIEKKAQAPLFKPVANMGWSHGAPNMSDFYQSRMNPSKNISNNKPWEEIRVGPGLNKGYSAEGTNGFNAGMMAREEWLPKTVDQLRNTTNPKVTYGLAGHEGPGNSVIKKAGLEGKMEKHKPDTFYVNSPDRWFTTGGQEKAQTARSEQPMQPVNRPFTTREYFGTGGGDVNGSEGTRTNSNYTPSRKPTLEGPVKYPGAASIAGGGANSDNDYGKNGYKVLPNARSTTGHREQLGIVGGLMKAAMAPIMDVLRPSRKENVVGNLRPNGNVQGAYGVDKPVVWNPADRTRTTIKEQTIINKYQAAPTFNSGGGYETNEYQPIQNQRQTTNCVAIGGAGATPWSQKAMSHEAARNAHLNPNREVISKSRANGGNMNIFNSNMNIKSSKIGNMHSSQGIANMPKQTSNMSNIGSMGHRNNRESMIEMKRTHGNLLKAFNENPFTHSLSSVA